MVVSHLLDKIRLYFTTIRLTIIENHNYIVYIYLSVRST